MRVIKPHVKSVVFHIPEGFDSIEKWLESIGRVCYKSEDKITEESALKFIRMIRKRGHHAMLEHAVVTARIVADRGLTHELVRHRLASYAQESTRYCNYSKDKFGNEITVIEQPGLETPNCSFGMGCGVRLIWEGLMYHAEQAYFELLDLGVKPQIARSVLPIGLKSEIVCTANLREWMHIFSLRADKSAHPIIRSVALEILKEFNERLPSIYEEQAEEYGAK